MRTGTFGAIGATALVWAIVWAAPGLTIEAIDNVLPDALPFASEIDMWPQTLGLPGLVAGLLFSVLLPITERRARLAELSMARAAGWGAVSGLLVGVLVVWVMDTGLSDPLPLALSLAGVATVLGTVSGVVTPLLFRAIAHRRAAATS